MQVLIWIHVISAIVGIGPTFAFGLFLLKNQSVSQLRHSLNMLDRALMFNKMGAPLAAVSGILLMVLGNYGGWLQLWILGALFLFIVITVLSIPLGNKLKVLQEWADKPEHNGESKLPSAQENTVKQMHITINVIHVLSILLFTLMILKPIVF